MENPKTVSDSPRAKRTRRVETQEGPKPQLGRNAVVACNPNPLVHLPEDILENVFSFLPIKDAVRVGTVSTRFKKTWILCRKLLFGRDFALRYYQGDLVALVDRVFDSNEAAKIQVFCLHIDPVGVEDSIERWVGICIEKGIEELEFQFIRPFTLSSYFLNIQTLKTLELVNCVIQLPVVLTGLRFLHTLVLRQLQLTEEQLETLLFYCKMLGTLDLSECSRIRHMNISAGDHKHLKTLKIACCVDLKGIEINAPTLRSLFFCGIVLDIHFAQVLPLKEAFINFIPSRGFLQASKLEHLVIDLCNVTVLTTSCIFLEALTARVRDGIFREMQFCLGNLKELQLFVQGGTFCNTYDIAVFLKSCPCLEMLFIDLNDYSYECGLYWELHLKPMLENFPYHFYGLKFIKLIGFKFERWELELVVLLLKKAIFLEALVFITPRNNGTKLIHPPDYYSNLFHACTASPRARMFFFEHFNDRNSIYPSHPRYWY